MADIKTKKVDRSSIKTVDRSISASHRIRDAGSEIRQAGRREVDVSEQSVSEYSTARFEEGVHRTIAKAEHAAEWSVNKGTRIAQEKMREHGVKEKIKSDIQTKAEVAASIKTNGHHNKGIIKTKESRMQETVSNIKGRASSVTKSRQNTRMRRSALQTQKKSQEAMRNAARNSYRTAKAGASIVRRLSVSVVRSAKALFISAKALLAGMSIGGVVAVLVVVVCCLFGAAFYSIGDEEAGYDPNMENIFIMDTGPGILALPIEGMTQDSITSRFGLRDSPGGIGSTNHKGLDIGMPTGTIIRACESGTVTAAGWGGGHGKRVIIDHGDGMVTLYAHMSRIHATKGQKVQRGQVIGEVGNTGNSTGPHLHLEVIVNGKYMDPEKGFLSIPK